jgi:hypothetical protein
VTRRVVRLTTADQPLLDVFSAARRGTPERLSIPQIEQIRRTVRRKPLCVAPHNGIYVE